MTAARFFRILRQRWQSLIRRDARDADLDRELDFHLEQLAFEKMAEGLSEDEARLAARREFGNLIAFREQSQDARGWRWLADLGRDLTCGLRLLRRHKGVTASAVASLGIGIGASATVWTALESTMFDPLPFLQSDRLVAIRAIHPGQNRTFGATSTDYFAWTDRSRTLEAFGASYAGQRVVRDDWGPPDRVDGPAFTPSLFRMLGVRPLLGELFDDAPGPFHPSALVVLLSHQFWQRRYGGDAGIVGQSIRVDGALRRVIGVMPPDFRYQDDRVALWIPLTFGPNARQDTGAGRIALVTARLAPGQSVADAQAELSQIAADVSRAHPDRLAGWGVVVTPLQELMYGWARPLLLTLAVAAVLILAVACTNVAGLLLAQGLTRYRELRMRVSLGASRARLARQLFTEAALLSAGGGLVGLLLAAAGTRTLSMLLAPPPGMPHVPTPALDATLLLATIVCAAVAAVAAGLMPAVVVTRGMRMVEMDLERWTQDRRRARMRGALVAAQVALATILVIGAGLLWHSFVWLSHRPLNLDLTRILSFRYVVNLNDYATNVGQQAGVPSFTINRAAADAITRVIERLESVEGVDAVAGISYPPINSLVLPRFDVRAADSDIPSARVVRPVFSYVTPGYFAAMRSQMAAGREFSRSDGPERPPVVIVNESFGRALFGDVHVLHRQVFVDLAPGLPPHEIVGVVRDIPLQRNAVLPEPQIYAPYMQTPSTFRGLAPMLGHMTFILRGAPVAADVRRAAAEVDSRRPVVDFGIVERHFHARMNERRNFVTAAGVMAATVLLLAGIGVYGMTSFAVAARTREVGIRRALGAGGREVVAAIVRRTAWLIGVGLAAGGVLALWLTRFIAAQLWGVSPTDAFTFGSGIALLAIVAASACVVPVRRALAVDPAVVLRAD